ncbi:hypothetical protein OK18_19250 [Chryseobacterium gallinarum]|uniref:Uncharacterized protein n=1 Tax=Chryseobacterium gallinarum TaxID=1324352 RepID=A0A0G3M902_CHRGL|nr:hypothetical protein [Chryseobacterium gallinarum]AKK74468.1 hypothetical protein OK18_19250 [Chryseobacterium gallinarum]
MEKEILKKVLQLDSLIGFLSWQERVQIHLYNDNDTITSKKVLAAFMWILKENWEPPEMNYGQDRLLYWYDPDSEIWFLDEDYLKIYQEYKEELTQLKYYDRK